MDKELSRGKIDKDQIDLLLESFSNPEMELRRAVYLALYDRLKRFFETKNKTITRETELKTILKPNFTEADWEELNQVGLRVPMLQRSKLYDRLILTYVVAAGVSLVTLAFKNFELIFVVWELPILTITIALALTPIALFVFMFKRNQLPCDTIDELIEFMISIHWTELMADNKKLQEIVAPKSE